MVYIGRTFKYMFGAFWALALVCLPAAVALGIFTKPMASVSYLVTYAETNVRGFTDILWLVFNRYATVKVYPLALVFVTLVFCSSLCMSIVEKHFRVGKLMLRAPLKQINNYFLPVLVTYVLLTLVITLYGFIQSGVIALLHVAISGWGYPNAFNVVLAAVVSLGLFVLAVFVFCSAMYWTPMMVIYGFSFRDAAASSFRLLDGKTGGILIGLLTPFLIVAVAGTLLSFAGNVYVRCAVGVLLYLFLIVYVISFIMVSMFGLSGMERRDIKSYSGGNYGGV